MTKVYSVMFIRFQKYIKMFILYPSIQHVIIIFVHVWTCSKKINLISKQVKDVCANNIIYM